ncbi:pyridoxal 4-dehydrogenase [Loktanella sp. S4079]|nr:pyridoxal 4-dehydrogenase [Loktanella sp. S4079]
MNSRTQRPINLTTMGFGSAPLGNLYQEMSEDTAKATLEAAIDAGIRYFDTAPFYGLGLSEERIGRALHDRDDIVLSTKVGRILTDCPPNEATPEMFVNVPARRVSFDYSYDGIMRSYLASMHRLGERKPDILLLHDIDPGTHGQAVSDKHLNDLFCHGGYTALDELRSSGEIGAIGAGVNDWRICEKLMQEAPFDCFLLAGRYTLLEQEALDSFLPRCVSDDVGIILGGPYNSGILATGATPGARYNYAPAPPEIIERVQQIEQICATHDVPLIAAALQFVMGHPAVRSVIPGAATPDEIANNVALFDMPIPSGLWTDLKSAGLIRDDAPTPKGNEDAI